MSATAASPVLAHRVGGEGPPLLLLNGGMMSMSAWEPVARRLAERHRVIRCDFRGQLLSPGVPPVHMEGHAEDLVRLLDELSIPRVDVVAASFGAYVGLLLAALHPERVASVLAATVTDAVDGSMGEGSDALAAAVREAVAGGDRSKVYDHIVSIAYSSAWRESHREELAARRAQMGFLPQAWFAGLDGLLRALVAVDLKPYLPKVACPVLVLAAECDSAMPLARTEAVARAIPGADLVVVPGSGHAVSVEKEDEFLQIAERFLERAAREARPADTR
ncbi:MAG TPA: alpha/beta hydrolase [Thermoanaerobaculia bacterium]|nr:alpha/beta hydrolase [Thermoanaerobaculia bacterium]